MGDEELTSLLREDFDALAATFDADRTAEKMRTQFEARDRMRKGVLGVAAMFGAALAASQFAPLINSASRLAPAALTENTGSVVGTAYLTALTNPVMLASLVVAAAAMTTAIVLQREG